VTLATLARNARALRAPFAERPKAEDAPSAAATTAGWIRGTLGRLLYDSERRDTSS
jgi:hypothetical protein